MLPENQLEVTGEPEFYQRTSLESGRTSHRRGCAICFTRLYNTSSFRPGFVTVKAGTLDRSDELIVVAHIWTKRHLAGIAFPDGVPSWPESPPPAEFIAALTHS
jgi:hypothetical protein